MIDIRRLPMGFEKLEKIEVPEIEKKVHAVLRLKVFGDEYQETEITWSGSPLDLIKAMQEKLSTALLSMNNK